MLPNRLVPILLLLGVAVVTSGISQSAFAQSAPAMCEFDIPAQDLGAALEAFGHLCNQQLAFDKSLVQHRKSQALRGHYSADAAMERLLDGSGLTFKHTATGVLVVQAPARPNPALMESGNVLEEVIVTAQKRTERLQDVPVSMGVLTSAALEKYHPLQMSDYAGYVPGLEVAPSGRLAVNSITLRGLVQQGGDTPLVATYIDDVPVGASGPGGEGVYLQPDISSFDLDRVEVLRGPQGTLWGANSISGLVRFVLAQPNLNAYSAKAGADVFGIYNGDGLGYSVRGAVNIPLVDGKLALRVSASRTGNPGFIDNALTGAKGENQALIQSGRIGLLWQVTDKLSIKGQVLVQHTVAEGAAGMLLSIQNNVHGYTYFPGPPLYGDLTSYHRIPEPVMVDVQLMSTTLDWQLGFANLIATSGYSIMKIDQRDDWTDGGRYGDVPYYTGVTDGYESDLITAHLATFTQEFRLESPGEQRLQWMLGAFYDNQNFSPFAQYAYGYDANLNPIGTPFLSYYSLPDTFSETSLFGNTTFRFTNRLDVTAGMRWDETHSSYSLSGTDLFNSSFGYSGRSKSHNVGYSVAARYHFNADGMVYARMATGFRPGGPNLVPVDQVQTFTGPRQYGPDSTVNHEIGVKADFLDRRVQLDAAVFLLNWKDIQVSQPFTSPSGDVNYVNVNLAKARSQGVEISITVLPVKSLQLTANVAHYDSKVLSDLPDAGYTYGQVLPGTSPWTGSVSAEYSRPVSGDWEASIGGGMRYAGKKAELPTTDTSVFFANNSTLYQDLNASLSDKHWRLALYCRNFADKRSNGGAYYDGGTVHAYGAAFSAAVTQPRTIGLSIDRSL